MFAIFIAIVCLIVYGSLYPWEFHLRDLPSNPLWMLLTSWGFIWDRRFLADIIVNLALYIPLGASGYLAFRRFRIAAPILIAVAVSGCVEMAQLFTATRNCSAIDLVNNVAGSVVGVAFGAVFESLSGPGLIDLGKRRWKDPRSLALLFCWVAMLLFPLYPETHLGKLRADLARFAHSNLFELVPLLSAATSWFVAGRLIQASGFRKPGMWLTLSLLALPAQFLIISRQPTPVDFIGALIGCALYVAFGSRIRTGLPSNTLALGFVALLIIRGLAPFHFAESHGFIWVPFQGFLDMNWQTGIQVLLEKTFYYGSAMWLLRTAGIRFPQAVGFVAVLLTVIEGIQTHLPGRTAEITEPILGLLIGLGLWGLNRPRRSGAALLPRPRP